MDALITNSIFSYSILLLIIAINIYFFMIKRILKKNGYSINYFYGHFNDLINFNDLIKNEVDMACKKKYKSYFIQLLMVIILFIICIVVVFSFI